MKTISVEQMRKLDKDTIEKHGIEGKILMFRAAEKLSETIIDFTSSLDLKHVKRVVFLAGKGNNGGDAYAAAGILREKLNIPIVIFSIVPISEISGDALYYAKKLNGVIKIEEFKTLKNDDFKKGDIIIDGLLGTGFSGKLRENYKNWISTVNQSNLPVISIDIPSGLNGDTGICEEEAITADITVTMGFPKKGLVLNDGLAKTGRIVVADIGFPETLSNLIVNDISCFSESDALEFLGRVVPTAHKKTFGSVLVIGGSDKYNGAPILSGYAALKSGCGFVTIAVPKSSGVQSIDKDSLILSHVNDSSKGYFSKESIPQLIELASKHDVIVIGPGMSQNEETASIIEPLLALNKTTIIDADALNLISKQTSLLKKRADLIFTPHPGEAKRLANAFQVNEEDNRIDFAKLLVKKTNGIMVLKGHRTIIANENHLPCVNISGTPLLATAGSGDLLSGMIAASLANKSVDKEIFEKVYFAVYMHGLLGEISEYKLRGITADELIKLIPLAAKKISPFR